MRASTEADVARCAEIYGHHVLYGTASFEVDPPDLAVVKRGELQRDLSHASTSPAFASGGKTG